MTVYVVRDFKGFEQLRHFTGGTEVDIDDRPDHLDDRAYILLGGSGFRHGKNRKYCG
jgi:hypothetical protein